jgi:hypothetical protein
VEGPEDTVIFSFNQLSFRNVEGYLITPRFKCCEISVRTQAVVIHVLQWGKAILLARRTKSQRYDACPLGPG